MDSTVQDSTLLRAHPINRFKSVLSKVKCAANVISPLQSNSSKASRRPNSAVPRTILVLGSKPETIEMHRESKKARFGLWFRVLETNEMFKVPNLRQSMKIRELKSDLELVAGIPIDFIRLSYLDRGDLVDESSLCSNDIIPGTTLTLSIWPYDGWPKLVQAAASGVLYLLKSVISQPVPPQPHFSPVLDRAPSPSSSSTWRSHRLFSALFIAAHRGHMAAIRFLISQGADIVCLQTPLGRGVLHVAASQGHEQIIQELLVSGAPLTLKDREGMTALSVANRLGQRKSTRQLFLFHWQERATHIRLKSHLEDKDLFPHQRYDSHLRTWRCGNHCQRYMAHLAGERRGNGGKGEGRRGVRECWGGNRVECRGDRRGEGMRDIKGWWEGKGRTKGEEQ